MLRAPDARQALEGRLRRQSLPPPLARRARSSLAAADGHTTSPIARHLALDVTTVRLWRHRWLACAPLPRADLSVEARRSAVPRAGRRVQITADQRCTSMVLACAVPAEAHRPIRQWSGRELAADVVTRGIVPQMSRRHAARRLTKGSSNPTCVAPG